MEMYRQQVVSQKVARKVEVKQLEGEKEHARERERGETGHSCLTFTS